MTWDDIKGFLGVAVICTGVLVLALVEVLRRKFASLGALNREATERARLDVRLTKLEEAERAMPGLIDNTVREQVGEMATTLNKEFSHLRREVEQMTTLVVSCNDRVADQHTRLQRTEDRVAVLDQIGSQPTRKLAQQLVDMDKKLDRLLDRDERERGGRK